MPGRANLIKSVLMALLTNTRALIFILNEIEQLCMKFLWGGKNRKRGMPVITLDSVCDSEGAWGLGIRRLRPWRTSLIAKHVVGALIQQSSI